MSGRVRSGERSTTARRAPPAGCPRPPGPTPSDEDFRLPAAAEQNPRIRASAAREAKAAATGFRRSAWLLFLVELCGPEVRHFLTLPHARVPGLVQLISSAKAYRKKKGFAGSSGPHRRRLVVAAVNFNHEDTNHSKEKTGSGRRALPVQSEPIPLRRLTPVPFEEDVPVVTVLPSRGNPHGTLTRRKLPTARHPHVVAAVPALITGNPDVSRTRSHRPTLHNPMRWADPHDNFSGLRRSNPEPQTQHTHQQNFAHLKFLLQTYLHGHCQMSVHS